METVKLELLIKKTKVARCGEHSYPVLSITKQDGIIMQSEKFKKRIASADTSDYKIIPRGKLVQGIHIDEGNFGIQDIVDNGIVSPAYGVWDVNDGLVIPKYLEMVLRSPKSIEFYRSKLTGTVNRRGHMSDADFLSMDIPLPDRDTQSKILKTMKQTTSVLYSRQQQLAKLDELIKARFVELTENVNTVPNRMGDIATYINGYAFKPTDWKESGLPIIRIQNLNDATARYNYFDGKIDSKYLVTTGDILVSWATHLEAYIWNGNRAWLNQHIFKVLFNKIPINKIYFVYATEDALRQAFKNAHGFKPTMEHIKRSDFENAIVRLPPMEIQNQFADFVAEVDKSKVEVQKALDQTQLLFDSLMQQYFG